jgi:fatty acid desaturase
MNSLFRYSQDRLPVLAVLGLTALDFGLYFTVESWWVLSLYWVLSLLPKGVISAWNHHHQHSFTFHSPLLNRGLEVCYALHTGMTTHLWLLHHVLGHHLNYLNQPKDESGWQRKDGTTMGEIEYSVRISLTAYYRAFLVGKRYPRHQRTFLSFAALSFMLAGTLVWFRPMQGLMLFVLPMCSTMLFTSWVTYDHHAGLDSKIPFEASYNTMNRWFNMLTGNLGYHTAHHYKQGLHWSQLPSLHETIKDKIPAHLYHRSTFDVLLPR